MKNKAAWKYVFFAAGITLTAIMSFSSPLVKTETECVASRGQTVVKWKDQQWPCRHWWSIRCRRKHSTYKVTLDEGIPLRDKNGMPVVIAGGRIRAWKVYDSAAWNGMKEGSLQRKSYSDYEPIAENEYVVMVQTRYRLFNNVEATLRICTEKPNLGPTP